MIKRRYLPPQVSDASEVLHLKLWEGSLFDYSLSNHPGTLNGTLPTYQFPGVDLPGTDEYISVADHADFSPALSPFSISAWINMDDATNFQIANKGVINADGEWAFATGAADKLLFLVYDESETAWIGRSYDTALSENVWLHVVATYNGGTTDADIKLYLNGVNVDNADDDNNVFITVDAAAGNVRIGELDGTLSNGMIDDVRIYTTERTAVQVRNFYELTRWRYGA